jgi:hypothetical protein
VSLCNKIAFGTKGEAKRFAKGEGRNQSIRHAGKKHVYLCERCGRFHLTSISRVDWRKRYGKK